jgi:hypothetical protein
MEAKPMLFKKGCPLKRMKPKKLVIYVVLVMLLMSSFALFPEDVEAQGPGRKDITLYLHNVTPAKQVGAISTLRIMNSTLGTSLNTTPSSASSVSDDWYLYPVLANDTAIQGNVTLHIWALRTARTGDNRGASLSFTLYDYDASGTSVGTIASASVNFNMINDWREYLISAGSVARYNVTKGHTLRLFFDLSGSASNYYQVAWGDNSKKSRLTIETFDWVRMNSAVVLDHNGVPKTNFRLTAVNKSVTFRANVTDPFGGYDIRYVNATLVAPNGTKILDMATMQKTKGFFNSYFTEFSYGWNYSGYPTGQYNLTVYAVDNTGYYYRYPTNPGDATYGGHLVSLKISFWIGGMPYNATVTVLDSQNQALAGAKVTIADQSGKTDSAGKVVLRVANGTYVLRVVWQDVVVYSGSALVLGDTNFTVRTTVYSPPIIAVDDLGTAVEDAVAFLEHPNGSVIKG